MQPRKTALAHTALQTHRAGLDMRQRRILIMADGRRSLDELSRLLGPDTAQRVATLIRDGYLTLDTEQTLHEVLVAPQAAPIAELSAQARNVPTPAAHRRSFVAARLYLLGMLELQRDPAAQQLHQQLHFTTEEHAAVEVMLEALAVLPQLTSPGYAQRVQIRLGEVLPEEHLPALARIGQPLEA